MAIKTDMPLFADPRSPQTFALSDVTLPGAYLMVGDVILHLFDQTAEIVIFVYQSEEARRQDESIPHEQRRPLRVVTVHAPFATYTEYLEEAAKGVAAACYRHLTALPEPHGLKTLLESGEAV